jgi:phosphate acetyltransferase
LRTKYRISHAYLIDTPAYHKTLIITDAAINIAPDAATKADICQNAIMLWRTLYGTETLPKVAILAAVEVMNPKMQATVDAAILCKMADRGQITGGILDGPLAFDNAINKQAAEEKGIISNVAGDADILLVPEIETGNVLAKQLTFLGGGGCCRYSAGRTRSYYPYQPSRFFAHQAFILCACGADCRCKAEQSTHAH